MISPASRRDLNASFRALATRCQRYRHSRKKLCTMERRFK